MPPHIRPATPADFSRLDELERACPMAGDTTLFIYREGDYTRILRFFTRSYMWVAEVGDRLVGSVSWSWQPVLVNERPEPVGWLADVRVHPDYRKSPLIYHLFRQAHQQASADGVDLTIGTTLVGNSAVENLTPGRAGFPHFVYLATFDMLQLYPGLPVQNSLKGLELRPATRDDLTTICELLNSYYQRHQFRIEVTPERLQRVMALTEEGMRIEDYVLAHRNGKAVAVAHTWDQGTFKKPIVEAYSPYLALVASLTRLLNRFTPLPALPITGGILRYLWLRDIACGPGYEPDLTRLVRWFYHRMKGSRYHFLMAAVQRGDAMERLYRGIFRTRVTLKMWACSLSGRNVKKELAPEGKRLYHDFTLT
ncbi:MAG: GNAT family N-acetyltransferase [Candidatus Neomarinimicrobiota bacterium]